MLDFPFLTWQSEYSFSLKFFSSVVNGVDHEKESVEVVMLESNIAKHIPIIYTILYIIVLYNIQYSYILTISIIFESLIIHLFLIDYPIFLVLALGIQRKFRVRL